MFRSFSKPDLPSDIDACFPFPTSPARIWFYSMVQKDARLIAAAVRWTIVGREPWPTDEVVQLSVVSENILKTFSDDQFKVIQGMEYMIDFANTLERNVCYIHGTSPRVSDQFHAAVPNMDKEFHNNFLPTVFRLLRKLVSCTGKSYERESTIVANSPKYMPFLRELIPKLLEQSLPVAESAVTPGSGSESQTNPTNWTRRRPLYHQSRLKRNCFSQTSIMPLSSCRYWESRRWDSQLRSKRFAAI